MRLCTAAPPLLFRRVRASTRFPISDRDKSEMAFGGFVGLVSFLGIFFRAQYALTNVQAATFAMLCALNGSIIRPLGGYLSDRFGGIRVLTWLYLGVAATMAGVSALPALGLCALLLVTGMTLLVTAPS